MVSLNIVYQKEFNFHFGHLLEVLELIMLLANDVYYKIFVAISINIFSLLICSKLISN